MKHILCLVVPLSLLFASCSKSNSGHSAAGTATLTITPLSNGSSDKIVNTAVYIKSNTLSAPPAGIAYDSLKLCNRGDGINTVNFSTLPDGNYHIYAISSDTATNNTIQGDLSVTISGQNSRSLNLPMVPPGNHGSTPLIIIPRRYAVAKDLIDGMVYIKYNSAIAPVNNLYDDSVHCVFYNGAQVGVFSNMARGSYYIRAVATDTLIHAPVEGAETLQIGTTDSLIIYLPVLE